MFRQLKKSLLILNIISIIALMIIAFSSIYLVTYQKTMRDISNLMNRIESVRFNDDNELRVGVNVKENNFVNVLGREIFFTMTITNDNKIVSTSKLTSANEDFFDKALSAYVLAKDKSRKYLDIGESKWAYRAILNEDNYQILFVDVTNQINMLNRLIYTFLLVFVSMGVLTFIISNYLTNISIRPIKSAFKKQNQFISDASHELKTPLTIINSNVDVLLSDIDDKSNEKWLKYIKSEVTRMTKLTENLLYLSEFSHSGIIHSQEKIDFSELLEVTLLGIDALVYEKNIELDYIVESNIYIKANKEQISQVAMILIDNAIKYCDKKIDISLSKNASEVKLEISNDGVGIAKDDIDRIFDRFYKVDASRSVKSGFGLGLPIALAIVNEHNGTISCSSFENKNTFIVSLNVFK